MEAIDLKEASKYTGRDLGGGDSQFAAFLVGLHCTADHETKYFFNGKNYFFVLLDKEDGEWKQLQFSSAALELLESVNRSARTANQDLSDAIINVQKRYQGIYTNAKG